MKIRAILLSLLTGLVLMASQAFAQVELRFLLGSDSEVQAQNMQMLVDEFMEANPDIKVVLDLLPYATIRSNYNLWLESGEGPDIGRVTDLGGLSQYYLDLRPYVDNEYFEANYGPYLDWLDPNDTGAIYGYHSELTITGPFINKTYFEQAGVEIPGAGATWDDWAEASRQVAEAISGDGLTVFPMAMDRSGHRVAGPAISQGAQYFDADGNPAIDDEGFRAMMQKMVDWHADGTMYPDIWISAGGDTYANAGDAFVNGELAFVMSGSWQLGSFNANIGDTFDWTAIPNPCGPGGCTGMPGGAAVVAFNDTEHPAEAARFVEFLASEDAYRQFAVNTASIPAHIGLANEGLDYGDVNESLGSSLSSFASEVGNLSPVAFQYQGYPSNFVMFNATVTRLSQALTGELSVDDAVTRMVEDIAEKLNE